MHFISKLTTRPGTSRVAIRTDTENQINNTRKSNSREIRKHQDVKPCPTQDSDFFQVLPGPPLEREPQHGGGADSAAHWQGRETLLHRRRGLRGVPLRVLHLRPVSELQPAIRLAPGHGEP